MANTTVFLADWSVQSVSSWWTRKFAVYFCRLLPRFTDTTQHEYKWIMSLFLLSPAWHNAPQDITKFWEYVPPSGAEMGGNLEGPYFWLLGSVNMSAALDNSKKNLLCSHRAGYVKRRMCCRESPCSPWWMYNDSRTSLPLFPTVPILQGSSLLVMVRDLVYHVTAAV